LQEATAELYRVRMARLADIGSQLVVLRRALGLTQGELAERLGVKRQQVQRWESSAYRSASLERVARVAAALGWSDLSVPIAAETTAAYGSSQAPVVTGATPVRDLGEIAVRVRDASTALSERFGVRSVAVFGSFAMGLQTATSDVDVLLELETPSLETQFGAERELERILGRTVETGSVAAVNPRVRSAVIAEMVRVWPA
jgi:predicted nucleotidyltransferase/DNA-binding XRE family transcriptional regulator